MLSKKTAEIDFSVVTYKMMLDSIKIQMLLFDLSIMHTIAEYCNWLHLVKQMPKLWTR